MRQQKKWKRSVAWFLSYGAKCIAEAEHNFSTKCNISHHYGKLCNISHHYSKLCNISHRYGKFYCSVYYIALCKIDLCSAKTVYNVTVNFIVPYTCTISHYVKLTHALVKRQLESRQRHLGKTEVVKVGGYIVSINRKTTTYRLEAHEIAFFVKLSIAMCSHISLTCL